MPKLNFASLIIFKNKKPNARTVVFNFVYIWSIYYGKNTYHYYVERTFIYQMYPMFICSCLQVLNLIYS